MKKYKLLALLLALSTCYLYSQTTASHFVKIVANPILELKFDESFDNRDFSFSTLADYDNGKTNLQAAGLKVRSNKNWVVNVKSNASTFVPSSEGDSDIKSTALLVRKSGSNTNIPIDTFDQIIASGTNGGFDKNTFVLDYIANPGYIKPDSYSLEITYTLTTP